MSIVSNRIGFRRRSDGSASASAHAPRPQRRIVARLTAIASAAAAAITAAHDTHVPY